MRFGAGLAVAIYLFLCMTDGSYVSASAEGVSHHALLARAREYEKQGKLLSARKVYEKILSGQNKLGSGLKEGVLKKYEQISLKLVQSKIETPESDFYTVKPGDSLYKIAKRYDTTVSLLKKSNGLKTDVIQPGAKLKVLKAPFAIRVDKSENILTLDLGGRHFKRYRVSTGKNNSTPVGKFKIKTKLEDPTWYYAGAVVPPGSPDNYLGTRWLGFDIEGYGIHGTTFPQSIGKQESLGCVRLLNKDVEELYDLVPEGTRVVIQD